MIFFDLVVTNENLLTLSHAHKPLCKYHYLISFTLDFNLISKPKGHLFDGYIEQHNYFTMKTWKIFYSSFDPKFAFQLFLKPTRFLSLSYTILLRKACGKSVMFCARMCLSLILAPNSFSNKLL